MYCSRSDIDNIFGSGNIDKWADLNNDQVQADIDTRVDAAIVMGTARVDAELRGGPISIPFTSPIPPTIINAAAQLAGVWLYESRGVSDSDSKDGTHELSWHKKDALDLFRRIHAGQVVLDATGAQETTSPFTRSTKTTKEDLTDAGLDILA